MSITHFSEAQTAAIDYIVLCSVNQGLAYRNGQNAEQAVAITLEEDKRLRSHQLAHPVRLDTRVHIGVRMRREASRQVAEQWAAK